MRHLRKLFLAIVAIAMSAAAYAQQLPAPPIQSTRIGLPVFSVTPFSPATASFAVVGNPGNATYYYWIVTNFQVGGTSPSGPYVVYNGPNTLSALNSVTGNISIPTGATSIDVLRTTAPSPPTATCNCAVVTGNTTGSISDQSNALLGYTVSPFDINSLTLTLTNEVTGAGAAHLILRQAGLQVGDLSSPFGGFVGIVLPGSPGGDALTKLQNCNVIISALGGGYCDARPLGGTQAHTAASYTLGAANVYDILPRGTWSFTNGAAANPYITVPSTGLAFTLWGPGGGGVNQTPNFTFDFSGVTLTGNLFNWQPSNSLMFEFQIKGNRAAGSSTATATSMNIALAGQNINGIIMDGVDIVESGNHGVNATRCFDCIVRNSFLLHTNGMGIQVNNSVNFLIYNNHLRDTVISNSGMAIHTTGLAGAPATQKITADQNFIETSAPACTPASNTGCKQGIEFDGGCEGRITNNTIIESTGEAISFTAVDNTPRDCSIEVAGNTIINRTSWVAGVGGILDFAGTSPGNYTGRANIHHNSINCGFTTATGSTFGITIDANSTSLNMANFDVNHNCVGGVDNGFRLRSTAGTPTFKGLVRDNNFNDVGTNTAVLAGAGSAILAWSGNQSKGGGYIPVPIAGIKFVTPDGSPLVFFTEDLTAQTATVGPTNMAGVLVQAGRFDWSYALESTVICATPGPAQVVPSITFTDNGQSRTITGPAFALGVNNTAASNTISFNTSGAVAISRTFTVTNCTAGTATFAASDELSARR